MKILGTQKPAKKNTKQIQEPSGCLFLHRYSEIRDVFALREIDPFCWEIFPVFVTRYVRYHEVK